ncbi:hypothetical protein SCUP234_04805 [Seiridium cupressi]
MAPQTRPTVLVLFSSNPGDLHGGDGSSVPEMHRAAGLVCKCNVRINRLQGRMRPGKLESFEVLHAAIGRITAPQLSLGPRIGNKLS